VSLCRLRLSFQAEPRMYIRGFFGRMYIRWI
jgi:hypothetical protein